MGMLGPFGWEHGGSHTVRGHVRHALGLERRGPGARTPIGMQGTLSRQRLKEDCRVPHAPRSQLRLLARWALEVSWRIAEFYFHPVAFWLKHSTLGDG